MFQSEDSSVQSVRQRHFCTCIVECCLSFCKSFIYCLTKVVAKERHKSSVEVKEKNKVCERCFYFWTLLFCPSCSQCPHCCTRSTCMGMFFQVNLYTPCIMPFRSLPTSLGCSLRRLHGKCFFSVPESWLPINFLEIKAVLQTSSI